MQWLDHRGNLMNQRGMGTIPRAGCESRRQAQAASCKGREGSEKDDVADCSESGVKESVRARLHPLRISEFFSIFTIFPHPIFPIPTCPNGHFEHQDGPEGAPPPKGGGSRGP